MSTQGGTRRSGGSPVAYGTKAPAKTPKGHLSEEAHNAARLAMAQHRVRVTKNGQYRVMTLPRPTGARHDVYAPAPWSAAIRARYASPEAFRTASEDWRQTHAGRSAAAAQSIRALIGSSRADSTRARELEQLAQRYARGELDPPTPEAAPAGRKESTAAAKARAERNYEAFNTWNHFGPGASIPYAETRPMQEALRRVADAATKADRDHVVSTYERRITRTVTKPLTAWVRDQVNSARARGESTVTLNIQAKTAEMLKAAGGLNHNSTYARDLFEVDHNAATAALTPYIGHGVTMDVADFSKTRTEAYTISGRLVAVEGKRSASDPHSATRLVLGGTRDEPRGPLDHFAGRTILDRAGTRTEEIRRLDAIHLSTRPIPAPAAAVRPPAPSWWHAFSTAKTSNMNAAQAARVGALLEAHTPWRVVSIKPLYSNAKHMEITLRDSRTGQAASIFQRMQVGYYVQFAQEGD